MSGPTDLGDDPITDLVHRADLDGLVRLIDSFTTDREWSELLRLRDRARAAVETGRQLWPAATLAEYRLALHAPPEWAARVLDGESGRFTIGPLAEVVASRLTWADLDGLVSGPVAAGVAHERVARGEDLTGLEVAPVIELPLALAGWERAYTVPTYSDEGIDDTAPSIQLVWSEHDLEGRNPVVVDDDESARAFRQLVETWTDSSTGRCGFVCVEGDPLDALAALGLRRSRTAPVAFSDAIDLLAWAGATGAARGRRRGAALGRFGVWWLLAALCDLGEPWPPDPAVLGAAAGALEWRWWDGFEPLSGWRLSLCAHDRDAGLSWAMSAADEA
ncbi:MAG: hypothetical protein ACO3NX_02190 [Ilumatobacteraceae bacterium]